MTTREILEKTKAAWPSVRSAGADDKNRLLLSMAEHLMHHADEILFANAQDVEQARGTISEVMLDRLSLSAGRIESMAAGIRDAAALPDHTGRILDEITRPNGLKIYKSRCRWASSPSSTRAARMSPRTQQHSASKVETSACSASEKRRTARQRRS